MTGQPQYPNRPRLARLGLRLLPEELVRWRRAAARDGVPVSDLVRETVNAELRRKAEEER